MNSKQHRAVIGGCVRTGLITEATEAGKKYRNAIRRGDTTASRAFDQAGVGYPYMTAAEYTAAKAAFEKAAK